MSIQRHSRFARRMLVLALLAGVGLAPAISANAEGTMAATSQASWTAWGGEVGVRWNRELMADLGITIEAPAQKLQGLSGREHERFEIRRAGSLEFRAKDGNLSEITGGSLQARGGYRLSLTDGSNVDLTDFRIRVKADAPMVLEIVGSDGKAWFYIDRLMYELIDDNKTLVVRTSDVRISAELAQRVGHGYAANWAVADVMLSNEILASGDGGSPQGAPYNWHGDPAPNGNVYQADLFMQVFNMQYSRCTGCAAGSTTGQVVFTPSSTLVNNKNIGTPVATIPGDPLGTSTALYTAHIPWYQKFSGIFPPFNNDQHPYLIWNLYRYNADGSIDQIARSGVKHAFLTTNGSCLETPPSPSGHILARGCTDTYGTGNNDSNSDLGPRSEIIPATNQWGRCGSIYDVNCDGTANASGNTNMMQRMIATESDLTTAGATYRVDSWYLARQDINIYNSMATKRATFTKNGTTWTIGGNDEYRLGAAIDQWVSPTSTSPTERSFEIASSEGHTKVAVKVIDLGNGTWQYHYAVMNFDFARAVTTGTEPNLRVVHNFGFDRFNVPFSPGVTISNIVFSDGDNNAANDWVGAAAGTSIGWTAPVNPTPPANVPAVLNPLNWGTLFRFSFVADRAPGAGSVSLNVAQSGTPAAYDANVLTPMADVIYVGGFDSTAGAIGD